MGALSIENKSPLDLWRQRRGRRSGGFVPQGGGDTGERLTPGDAYLKNLAKLIPGEIITLYTLLNQIKLPADWADYRLVPFFCCLALAVIRIFATKSPAGRLRWILVLISLATFICWVYVGGDWFWTWKAVPIATYFMNVALVMLAFLAPLFVGDTT